MQDDFCFRKHQIRLRQKESQRFMFQRFNLDRKLDKDCITSIQMYMNEYMCKIIDNLRKIYTYTESEQIVISFTGMGAN